MKWHKGLFALLLVFLPTQLGFHLWPSWSMVLGRKIDYLSPTVYLTDIIIVFLLLFWIIEVRPALKTQLVLPVLLFAGLNIYFAQNQPEAIYKWIKVIEFGLLGLYIVRTKPHLSFVVWNLSFGVFYSSLIAIGQFILQHSIGGPFWFLGERTFSIDTPGIARIALGGREMLRAYATFPHPNVLGGFLAIMLPMMLQIKKTKWFYLVFGLGVVAMIMTFSRSAWVVGALGLVGVKNNSLAMINLGEESVVVRQELNTAAISLWQQSPLIGVGLGNFLVRLPQVLASRQIYFLQPVHNIYLLILAETGIVGFILFLSIIWRAINNKHFYRFSLLALLLLGLVDHYPLTIQQGQLLFTLVLALGLVQ